MTGELQKNFKGSLYVHVLKNDQNRVAESPAHDVAVAATAYPEMALLSKTVTFKQASIKCSSICSSITSEISGM